MKCAVVMPVGPGHEWLALDASESVDRAFQAAPGPFSGYAVIEVDDTQGALGRSSARNQGVARAVRENADWIFFLDADDLMHPGAFAVAARYIQRYDAVWGAISELTEDEEGGILRQGQLMEMSSFPQLLANDPAGTLQIGHFVKSAIALATPFNPDLDAGEDFDYYLRVWAKFNCIKIPQPLFFNRRGMHATGRRGGTGTQWWKAVRRVISEACVAQGFHTEFSYRGEDFCFFVENPFDIIQRQFLAGRFFEIEELDFLQTQVAPGAHIVEVGAHIGNHVVYYSRFMRPRRITVIEPNPKVRELLQRNLAINKVGYADLSQLGIAAGSCAARFRLVCDDPDNQGATRLEVAAEGGVQAVPLDQLIAEQIELIKIDVEGMELEVLQGAAGIIAQWRPKIMIEVFNDHVSAFKQWLERNAYRIVREFPYVNAINFVVEPR
jgi:FkbM family methyltransferase